MPKNLTFLTVLLIVLLLSGCSSSQQSENGMPATYEQKLKAYSKELEDIRSNVPDPDYPIENKNDFDYRQNTERVKKIYEEIKSMKPDKELEPYHKNILRSLKYAIEGAEMLELAEKGKSEPLYSQAIILITLNLEDVDRVIEKKLIAD